MDNINEGSRGAARLARLKAAAEKAVKTGNIAKERQINKTAGMAGGKTAVQTRMALRGGADPKTAKATMAKPGQKKAYDKRSAAIANFAARGVARKALAMGMKKIKPKRPMVAAEGVELDEGVKRKMRLLRAKMKAKNFTDDNKLKSLETAYDSELGRRVARKLRKGGAPKRTVVKFFNKDGTTPAADKAFRKFNAGEAKKVRQLHDRGIKPRYDHVEHDADAVVEGSMGAARMARRLRSNNAPSDIVDRMAKITKKRIVRAGGAEDLKARSKNPQANVRSLNALQRFQDMARARRNRVEEGYGSYDATMPSALRHGVKTFDKAKGTKSGVPLKPLKKATQTVPPKIAKNSTVGKSTDESVNLDEISDALKSRAAAKARQQVGTYSGIAHGLGGPEQKIKAMKMARKKLGQARKFGENFNQNPMRESVQLDEAGYKKLMRMKAAAYKAGMKARGDSGTGEATKKYAKLMRRAADQETRQDAKMALRGQASQKAVERGGSIIGKRGVPTQQGMKLADERKRALTRFKSGGAVKRYTETGSFDGKLDKEGVAEKRKRQQAQAKFNKQARTGDFGQDNQAALRARSNFQKRFGRLKGK